MIRPIAISLSPNLENTDALQALKLLFSPLQFFNGDAIKSLEQWFRRYFSVSHAISFVSGRGSLVAILKANGIRKGDEVILQAFTCVAVPNSVIAVNATPIYVDITDSLNINPIDLENKITKKTKAIIVQHTFGIPADMKEIVSIAKKHNILVIEDCAHTIGAILNGKKLGTIGDVGFFSFGRDKAFSSVFGGVAITNNEIIGKNIRQLQRQQNYPNFFWIAKQLFHPISFFIILPLYNLLSIGKIILVVFQKLHLLSFPVLKEEKIGKMPAVFLKKLPNALASLALFQLNRISEFNKEREKNTELYINEFTKIKYNLLYKQKIPLLRFPLLVENRDKLLLEFKKNKIYLGKWYSEIVDPKGVDFEKINYKRGSCPNAEYVSSKIINLPTYPLLKESDAHKIIEIFKNHV